MSLACDKRCGLMGMLANLRCRGCFGVEANTADTNGKVDCDCKVTINSEKIWVWE